MAAAIGWLAVVGAAGSAIMAVAHLGVELPLISALGPAGSDPVMPAVLAFAVGTLLFALTAAGVFARRSWAWPVGLAVNAIALAGAAMPYRGAGSAIGIAVTGSAIVLLASPAGRRALLYRLGSRAPSA